MPYLQALHNNASEHREKCGYHRPIDTLVAEREEARRERKKLRVQLGRILGYVQSRFADAAASRVHSVCP